METGAVTLTTQKTDKLFNPSWAWKEQAESPHVMVFDRSVDPDWSGFEVQTPLELNRYLATLIGADPEAENNRLLPKTVGGLYRSWVEQYALLKKITATMEVVSETMNGYATDNKLCGEYDEAVNGVNVIVQKMAPDWDFRFSPRVKQYRVIVTRERTIQETTAIYVDVAHGADISEVYELAINDADHVDDWEVNDDYYSVEEPQVVDHEIVD